jgi:hypothetical protein
MAVSYSSNPVNASMPRSAAQNETWNEALDRGVAEYYPGFEPSEAIQTKSDSKTQKTSLYGQNMVVQTFKG